MNASVYPNVTIVTLSEKNLRDLIAQLESGRETAALVRDVAPGHRLYVVAEPNEIHYAEREAGPGSGLVS